MRRSFSPKERTKRVVLRLDRLDDRIAPSAGDLDPTFGAGGKVITSFGAFEDYGSAVAVDGAGRILVAGTAQVNFSPAVHEFALARYNPDGSLDTSFDGDGKVTTAIGTGNKDEALGLAVQTDGKIVAAGIAFNGSNSDFAVVRYMADGALDPAFGTGGKVVTSFGASADGYAYSVAIDSLGRIVVGGFTLNAGDREFAVARYSANGVLDLTFGTGGKAGTSFGPGVDVAFSLAIDSSNRVVMAGRAHVGGNAGFGIVRYTANGVLDATFGTGGAVVTPSTDQASSVALDGADRIVVAGTASSRFAVARYTVSGTLDPTFGSGGTVTTVFAKNFAANQNASGMAIDGAGRIVVSGNDSGGTGDFALARYTAAGVLDSTFGEGGTVIQAIGTYSDFASCLAVDGSGSIVVAGGAYTSNLFDFAVARFSANNPPVLSSTSTALIYTENDGAVAIDPALIVMDSDDSNLVGATVDFVNYVSTEDILGYSTPAGISGTFDANLGILTLTGTASLADYQNALRSLTYMNTSDSLLEQPRTITITVDDGDATFNISNVLFRNIIVRPRNDAPSVIDDALLASILENNLNPPGRTVAGLFAGLINDPDANDTLKGIAVVSNSASAATEGVWQYSTNNGGTWFNVGTVADDATALALKANTRVRFLPVDAFSGRPMPLGVRAIDSTFTGEFTSGATRKNADTSINGGTTPIADEPANIETQVYPAGTGGNTAPTLLGVPISADVDEGEPFTFDASATDPNVGQDLTFSLAGAPLTADIDPDTGEFSWATTEADGPNTFVFNVQVTDGFVVTERAITVVVREVNVAPTLSGVPATRTTVRGAPVKFTAMATDPDILDGVGNALTFSLVDGPVGAAIDPDTGAFSWTPGDTLAPGLFRFRVRVVDDGVPAMSDTDLISITVANAAIVNGDLLIGGTAANDTITVNPSKLGMPLVVKLGRTTLGSFTLSPTGHIVVHGLSGNDRIIISSRVTNPADLFAGPGHDVLIGGAADDRLFGESGDDKLIGGKGNNLLVGGEGSDKLTGGTGRDVLIGGFGSDRLSGGAGEDLLIGGATDFDTDLARFANILAEWTSPITDYPTRISHLRNTLGGGLNNGSFLLTSTVHDDGLKDVLIGGAGLDWFLVYPLDLTPRALPTETKTML